MQGLFSQFKPEYYRSVFLSDCHIGSSKSDAPALLDCLKSFECDHLFLVGDVFDADALKQSWEWNTVHTRILDELIRKSQNGTKITYITGESDEDIKQAFPFMKRHMARKKGVRILESVVHTLADGRQVLVEHGSRFENDRKPSALSKYGSKYLRVIQTILKTSWYVGCASIHALLNYIPKIRLPDVIYFKALSLTKSMRFPNISQGFKKIYIPTAALANLPAKTLDIKNAIKSYQASAIGLLRRFEITAIKHCEQQDLDGIICGHSHTAALQNINGIVYANAGTWEYSAHANIASPTFVAEDDQGKLHLMDVSPSLTEEPYLPFMGQCLSNNTVRMVNDSHQYRAISLSILKYLKTAWNNEKFVFENTLTPKSKIKSLSILRRFGLDKSTKTFHKIQHRIQTRMNPVARPAIFR